MSRPIQLPVILPAFNHPKKMSKHGLYGELIGQILQNILADKMTFRSGDQDALDDQRAQLHALLPLVTVEYCETAPGEVAFFALAKCRIGTFKFFFDMLSGWLLPGKRRNVSLHYAVDFRMPEIGDEVYSLCQVVIPVENMQELEQIKRNFPIIESELRLGIASSYYARRILKVKGLAADEKTAIIQESLAHLIQRMPEAFDSDLLIEMQHILIMCSEEFKGARDSRHLSRLISTHYLFRKSLQKNMNSTPTKRHLNLKIFRATIGQEDEAKNVLGVLVGVNFFGDKEVFDQNHLLKAIQNYIPNAQAIENSSFISRRSPEHFCTIYLEIEKSCGNPFTLEEILVLKHELSSALKDRIEHLMNPIFMPRNEEEIMRNILSLSSQIKYLRDIPQVFITFDEQTHAKLIFTVILVRVLRPEDLTIQEMFKGSDTFLEYIHDRCQNIGTLRRKYKKEATVFRLKFPKDPFLRADHTIDLNKARQTIMTELCRIVGDVRDFNGGMISKQNEALKELRSIILKTNVKYDDLLLENFFYSLQPVIMRNVLDPAALKSLFLLLLESIDDRFVNQETYDIKMVVQDGFVFAMIKGEERGIKEEIARALGMLQLNSCQVAVSWVSVYDVTYLGYIYRTENAESQELFCQTLQNAMADVIENRRLATRQMSRLQEPLQV